MGTVEVEPMTSAVSGVAQQLERAAAEFVREHRLPGAAVGVVHGGELVWSAGVGFADIESRRAPDRQTLYRVASITKTFTGTAIMQLRDEGRLHLDDPAVASLPELRGAESPFGPIETVTIRRLLSHESGLMSDPPGTDWTEPAYEGDARANLARVAEIGTRVAPNTQEKYSNLGYQLLGEIVARVSGMPYAQYIDEAILGPLGMVSSAFDPLPDDLERRRATGYGPRAFSDDLVVSVAPPSCQAEGGLSSSLEDLARWISFQFSHDGGPREGAQVLSGSTLAEMHRPRYLAAEGDWRIAWGLTWYAERRDDGVWVQHSGGIHGFTTNVCFDPRAKVGGIALVNGNSDPEKLSVELATIARDAVLAMPPPVAAPAPAPPEWRDLLGLYADRDYLQVVRLEWRDGKLTFLDPGWADWKPTLAPTADPDRFVVEPGMRDSGEPCVFRRRADGRIHSVMLASQVLSRLDPVAESDQP
jgi:CubicO group peptidase (beta-lactamase class C family)